MPLPPPRSWNKIIVQGAGTGNSKGGQARLPGHPPAFGCVLTGLYALANVGAHLAFIPLLQILVPLRAVSIDEANAPQLLSQVTVGGALAASLANIVFGALSDLTHDATGGRRPWLIGGLAATLCSYAAIAGATTPAGLVAGVVLFQIAFNAWFAPLGAVMADDVPDARKGLVAALLGLGYPLGNVLGAQAVSTFPASQAAGFVMTGALVTACVAPLLLRMNPRARPDHKPGRPAMVSFNLLRHPDFTRALAGRLLVVLAISLVQTYLLLYLRKLGAAPGLVLAPEAAFARLADIMTGANVVCALAAGYASDRVGRRSLFVFAGAASMAAGIAGIGLAPSWAALQLAVLVYGAGAGVYYAVDLALLVQLLPRLRDAGKDLGFVNLSNTMPQVIAPLLALGLLSHGVAAGTGGGSGPFRALFLIAATAALLGGACVLGIRPAARQER